MALLTDRIGTIVMQRLTSASSTAVTADSTASGVNIQGMESVLFLTMVVTAGSSDGGATDGSIYMQVQYSSASANGSDAVTSNATMSCTDAVVLVNSTTYVAGTILPLEINISAKGFPDGAGYLFPATSGDSVSVLRVIAIPVPGTRGLPIAQTVATVIADD